jgi:hypothetical protein
MNAREVPETDQALSALDKALRDALVAVPPEQVLAKIATMFLTEELITAVHERMGLDGFGPMADAVDRQIRHDRLGAYLDELETEYGPVPAELLHQAQREWPDFEEN